MSNLEKIIDMVPYSNGGFRRRMTAGTIVNLSIGIALILSGHTFGIKIEDLKSVLSSPMVAIVFFLLVYAVGGLVEVLADLFITRLTGNTAWAIISPKYMFQNKHKLIRPILRMFAYYPGIAFLLYIEWGKAFAGKSSYEWKELEKELKPKARDHLEQLPDIVKDGIKDPFGKYEDLPWRYFSSHGANDDVKALARKLENRNKDVLVIVTSLMIAAIINVSFQDLTNNEKVIIGNEALAIILIQVLMLVPIVFLGSYFLLLKQSILTIIEYNTLSLEVRPIKEGHNNDIHPTTTVATAPSVPGDD